MREAFIIEHELPDGTLERVPVVRAQVFRRWRRRATAAFVGLALVSGLGIYLATNAQSSAITRSCVDRADVRIAVAIGFDELRRLAIQEPKSAQERAAVSAYIERTQGPIDRLLSDAAGAAFKTKGELTPGQIERVRSLAAGRCAGEARNASAAY